MNTEETQRKRRENAEKKQEKNFKLKAQYWFLEFSWKHTFSILVTFQNVVIIERWTTYAFQALLS